MPLHAANFERAPENSKYPLQRCWFSDGGLTSNFPIHFFDAPIPSWPTFGINLVPDTVETMEIHETDESLERVSGIGAEAEPRARAQGEGWDKVWMPSSNSTGISSAARFNRFKGLGGFFNALFDTARNWADTELMVMPSYRDCIVHVRLAENEGGLNLNMPPELITKLGLRGERAGQLLAGRFAPTPTGHDEIKDPQTGDDVVLAWDNHRWIRYRTFMAGLELVARRFRATWKDAAGQKPWRSMTGCSAAAHRTCQRAIRCIGRASRILPSRSPMRLSTSSMAGPRLTRLSTGRRTPAGRHDRSRSCAWCRAAVTIPATSGRIHRRTSRRRFK